MFRFAVWKLTLLYLAVIMLISAFFSVNLFFISQKEIERTINREQRFFQGGGRMMRPLNDLELNTQRQEQLETAKYNVAWQLLYVNIAIVIVGGGISYLFAYYTIRPIEKSHEKQKRFTSDASHELRTPLAAMKAEIEVGLRNKKADKQEYKDILKSNLEEVEKMQRLVAGLLSLARDEDAKVVLEKIDVKNIVEIVSEKYRAIKGAKIENDVESGLLVTADKTYFEELISILVDNAVKYSNGKIDVKVKAVTHTKEVEIQVTDKGVGIEEKDLPYIFDRFYRADASRTKNGVEGYGLGLSLAKKIVDLHKGSITVRSKVGEGSTFTVRLPQ